VKIGILALQGDFEKHARVVELLGHDAIYIKDSKRLTSCDKLIIPGGESTTIIRLIEKLKLRAALLNFAQDHGVMGTCAGLIVLANSENDLPFAPLGLINLQVERNAYGRQIDSFVDTVQLSLGSSVFDFDGVFIRAPKIIEIGSDIKTLGFYKNKPVMVKAKHILATSFHPELTDDLRVHDYFIDNI